MLVLSRLEGQRIRLRTSDGMIWIRLLARQGSDAILGITEGLGGESIGMISMQGAPLRLKTTDGHVKIHLLRRTGIRVDLGFTAPDAVIIEREEIIDRFASQQHKEMDHVSSKPV